MSRNISARWRARIGASATVAVRTVKESLMARKVRTAPPDRDEVAYCRGDLAGVWVRAWGLEVDHDHRYWARDRSISGPRHGVPPPDDRFSLPCHVATDGGVRNSR